MIKYYLASSKEKIHYMLHTTRNEPVKKWQMLYGSISMNNIKYSNFSSSMEDTYILYFIYTWLW